MKTNIYKRPSNNFTHRKKMNTQLLPCKSNPKIVIASSITPSHIPFLVSRLSYLPSPYIIHFLPL